MPYALRDWQFERRYPMEIGLERRQDDPVSSSPESTPAETETEPTSSTAETSAAPPTSSAAPPTSSPPASTPTPTPTSEAASPSQSATLPVVSETPTPSPTNQPESSSLSSQSAVSQTSTRSAVGSLSSAGSSPVGTQFVTSFITTNGAGQSVVTVSITSNYAVPTSAPSKSSNTGAIVGGVVGGVGGLLAIVILLWLLIRRRKKEKFEENMFEPDRNVDRPLDLVEGDDVTDPEAIARPYQLPPSPTRAEMGMSANSRPLSMQSTFDQYGRPLSSEHHEAISMPRPTSGNSYYTPPGAGLSMPTPMPLSLDHIAHLQSRTNSTYTHSQPATSDAMSDGGSSSTRALKEREARRMHVANQDGGVVVHSDGGRVNEVPEDEQPNEIPPTYDSIGGPSGAR